jgi:hypothetical protein
MGDNLTVPTTLTPVAEGDDAYAANVSQLRSNPSFDREWKTMSSRERTSCHDVQFRWLYLPAFGCRPAGVVTISTTYQQQRNHRGFQYMSISEQDRRRIVEQENQWVDPAFGGIDLSQFPSLQPPPPKTSRDDGRFSRDWRDAALSSSATALRQFVSDPAGNDTESLKRHESTVIGPQSDHSCFCRLQA